MIENLPMYVSLVFAAATVLSVAFYLFGIWNAERGITNFLLTFGVLVVLLAVHGFLAFNNFYIVRTIPPRFMLAPFPTIVILAFLFFVIGRGKVVSVRTLQVLTLLSIVRIPVELVLLWLYQHGQIPQLMTFEGRNFDVISGVSAPFVAWLAFRGGKINRPLLIGWNFLAFGLLLNIMTNAILSLETPFQQFAFDQPNRGILYFPFIWLPAVIVPVVFSSHIISLWELLKKKAQ